MLLMDIILKLIVTMNQVAIKKSCFSYFWRFLTRALTLSPRNMYIHIFFSLLWFLQFLRPFLLVLQARSKRIRFFTKMWLKRTSFMASTCTSLLLHRKPVQRNYRHFFQRFQSDDRVLRVSKTRITGENSFNGDHFGTEGNQESSNNKKKPF